MKSLFILREIDKDSAKIFIERWHYSKVLPKLNKVFLGGYIKGELRAVITLGWGVRPKHTIKKLFPSLNTNDYYEIGKMCLDDDMPRNSETQFLKQVVSWIKCHRPEIKVLYTWADGMLGKPGYVYQASNFLYGGYIWTDSYFTLAGEKVHPRGTRQFCKEDAERQGKEKVFWISLEYQREKGIFRYKGKQFRYCLFLCGHKERKRLLKESSFVWVKSGAKHEDLEWKQQQDKGYVPCDKPFYDKQATGKTFQEALHVYAR